MTTFKTVTEESHTAYCTMTYERGGVMDQKEHEEHSTRGLHAPRVFDGHAKNFGRWTGSQWKKGFKKKNTITSAAFKRALELQGGSNLKVGVGGRRGDRGRLNKKPAYSKVKNDDRRAVLMILFLCHLKYSSLPFLKLTDTSAERLLCARHCSRMGRGQGEKQEKTFITNKLR